MFSSSDGEKKKNEEETPYKKMIKYENMIIDFHNENKREELISSITALKTAQDNKSNFFSTPDPQRAAELYKLLQKIKRIDDHPGIAHETRYLLIVQAMIDAHNMIRNSPNGKAIVIGGYRVPGTGSSTADALHKLIDAATTPFFEVTKNDKDQLLDTQYVHGLIEKLFPNYEQIMKKYEEQEWRPNKYKQETGWGLSDEKSKEYEEPEEVKKPSHKVTEEEVKLGDTNNLGDRYRESKEVKKPYDNSKKGEEKLEYTYDQYSNGEIIENPPAYDQYGNEEIIGNPPANENQEERQERGLKAGGGGGPGPLNKKFS